MIKILVCFGTRPEAIKLATLIHQLQQNSSIETKVCITAQHREMLDQVLDFFEITPDFDLDIMQPNQTLNKLSSRILKKIDDVFEQYTPDLVIVHGDTTTSTLCALAAFHRHIKVAHVEAGLRTFTKNVPFPEEMNRTLTARIADYHFAPTTTAFQNIIQEGVKNQNIVVTGNTVIDSLFWAKKKLSTGYSNKTIEDLKSKLDLSKKIIMITAHRRENFGAGFINICQAIKKLALKYTDTLFVFPVHLNPNVQKPVYEILQELPNVILVKPLEYASFVWLMEKSYIILTDSGGVQEEAPSLGKPLLVLREVTERPEAVTAGTVLLVGTSTEKIVEASEKLIENMDFYKQMSEAHNPYGDGKASERILKFLLDNECNTNT